MAETEKEPGQTCYESHRRAAADGATLLQWGDLEWYQREAWRKQEAAEAWRERVAPLEGGSHE